MRFFTNDRDRADRDDADPDDGQPRDGVTTDEDRPDHVESTPVPVPQQRPASPWAEGPRHGEQALDEQARAHDLTGTPLASPPDAGPVEGAGRTPADQSPADQSPVDQSPADQSPADRSPADQSPGGDPDRAPGDALTDRGTFDDPVVEGAERADAPGTGPDDLRDGDAEQIEDRQAAEGTAAELPTAGRPVTGAHAAGDEPGPAGTGQQTTADPETAGTGPGQRDADDRHRAGGDAEPVRSGGLEEPALGERRGDDDPADTGDASPFGTPVPQAAAFGTATAGGAVGGAAASSAVAGGTGTAASDAERRTSEDSLIDDGGTFSDPVVVEPGGAAQTFAATDAQQKPGGAVQPEVGPLFADPGTFKDRWRDVQLRFVDDPKAAADDAAALVDEAVDALTAALRRQRAQLGETEATDTEQLRVRIRGYRDFLDRLLAL